MNIRVLGITAKANNGKDLLFKLLSKKIPNIRRFALADLLKNDLYQSIFNEYGINVFSCSRQDKELIRPKLVSFGEEMRDKTNGRYWIDRLTVKINKFLSESDGIACITDIRYENEASWLKEELGGILVHIKRYELSDGKKIYLAPPNDSEKNNDPILAKLANYRIEWPTLPREELEIYADELLKYVNR